MQGPRVVALVECARARRRFTPVQRALIAHPGPWDDETLLQIAVREGLELEETRKCLDEIDVTAQIAKDREHAAHRGAQSFPAVSVNWRVVPITDVAIRDAIRKVLLEDGV